MPSIYSQVNMVRGVEGYPFLSEKGNLGMPMGSGASLRIYYSVAGYIGIHTYISQYLSDKACVRRESGKSRHIPVGGYLARRYGRDYFADNSRKFYCLNFHFFWNQC